MNANSFKYPGASWRPYYVLRSLGFTDKEVMHMAGERIGMLRLWNDPVRTRHRHLTPRHVKRLRKFAAVLMSNVWGKLAVLLECTPPQDTATRIRLINAISKLNIECMSLLGDGVPVWKVDDWLEALARFEAAEGGPRDDLCD